MTYAYPATFRRNDDGSYTVTFPDLPGCISEGKDLAGALTMATRALGQWLSYLADEGESMPSPTDITGLSADEGELLSLVAAEARDTHAVRRTVSLPAWMDTEAAKAGLGLSRVLQDALAARLSKD